MVFCIVTEIGEKLAFKNKDLVPNAKTLLSACCNEKQR